MNGNGQGNGHSTGTRPPSGLMRSRFFPRQVVTAADLMLDQDYFRERLRQHHRLLHGCGVLCGLLVELISDSNGQRLRLHPGSAIDPQGNLIEVPESLTVSPQELCLLHSGPQGRRRQTDWALPGADPCQPSEWSDQTYFLALCYREEPAVPQPALRGDRCGGVTVCEFSRLRDSFELVLLDAITAADCVARNAEADDPAWWGEYYSYTPSTAPPSLPTTPPTLTRYDAALNFNWATGAPAFELAADHFMVRWRRDLYFPAGTYQFVAEADDGVRLWVDDQLEIDEWRAQSSTVFVSRAIPLAPGTHRLRLEQFENTGQAVARLHWRVLQLGWHAEYTQYAQPGDADTDRDAPPTFPTRSPDVVRTEATVNLDLRPGQSPDPDLYHNYFTVRWSRDIDVTTAAEYEFVLLTTDGSRLWVDEQLRIDAWHPQAPTTYRPRVMLAPGRHRLRLEHFERRGGELVRLSWQPIGPYNPVCRPLATDEMGGCVVLAALPAANGQFEGLDNFWFDRLRGDRRSILTPSADLDRAIASQHRPSKAPAIAQLLPGEGVQGSTLSALLLGQGLRGTHQVTMEGSGVEVTVLPGGTDSWVPLRITIATSATPGVRFFQLRTATVEVNSQDFNVTFRVVGLTPTTTPPPSTTPPIVVVTTTPPIVFTTTPPILFTTAPPIFTATVIFTTLPVFTATPIFTASLPINTGRPDGPVINPVLADQPITRITGDSPEFTTILVDNGIGNVGALANLEPQQLSTLLGISNVRAMGLIDQARRMVQ